METLSRFAQLPAQFPRRVNASGYFRTFGALMEIDIVYRLSNFSLENRIQFDNRMGDISR